MTHLLAPTALLAGWPAAAEEPFEHPGEFQSVFEHFETPLGVFEHTLDNPDFRAEGTPNEFGIRGYGERGRRVFDFGWVVARRGWAAGEQAMRPARLVNHPTVAVHRTHRCSCRIGVAHG